MERELDPNQLYLRFFEELREEEETPDDYEDPYGDEEYEDEEEEEEDEEDPDDEEEDEEDYDEHIEEDEDGSFDLTSEYGAEEFYKKGKYYDGTKHIVYNSDGVTPQKILL
jgi:hypothetical protein